MNNEDNELEEKTEKKAKKAKKALDFVVELTKEVAVTAVTTAVAIGVGILMNNKND